MPNPKSNRTPGIEGRIEKGGYQPSSKPTTPPSPPTSGPSITPPKTSR